MIKKILIDNFKLYKQEVMIPLSNLNLFTGINGKGKSTALQVFLLLSQSVISNRATSKIYLNGLNVKLGSVDDVKNKDTSFSEMNHFGFEFDEFKIDYFLHHPSSDASELYIEKIVCQIQDAVYVLNRNDTWFTVNDLVRQTENLEIKHPLFDLFLSGEAISQYFNDSSLSIVKSKLNLIDVHYVSADRIGPKNYYENKSLSHFLSVGALGENTVNLLHHKGNDKVNSMILEGYGKMFNEDIEDLSHTIEDNTNYWVGKIFQGAKVQVEPIKGEDLLKLRINSDGKSSYFKPTNVGYGFSYSLPIIVAGLTAKPGEILIVENPEAHLHPYAQSLIAKFLSLVSSTGVQVLVESHSEHILNGFRVAVKDKMISNEELNVLYFDDRKGNVFEEITVDEDGGVSNWPTDFFDQATNDLNYLLGI
jgi:predicted ATPase